MYQHKNSQYEPVGTAGIQMNGKCMIPLTFSTFDEESECALHILQCISWKVMNSVSVEIQRKVSFSLQNVSFLPVIETSLR